MGHPDELDDLISRFDVTDPAFLQWPYPVLDAIREATPIWRNPNTGQWMITRFSDVYESLRDRRLGEGYTHRYSHAEFGKPEPDPRWARFHEHERWSLLSIEPPDHTRLRRLVTKVFTPRAVEAMRPMVEGFADEILDAVHRARSVRPDRRLRPAVLGGRHLRHARRAAGRHAAAARLVAHDREDVRAAHRRRRRRARPTARPASSSTTPAR